MRVRADRDAQELLDARLAEVADDDAARPQGGGEFAGVALRVEGEDEVGGGGQDVEAEGGEFVGQRLAASDDGGAGPLEMALAGKPPGLRQFALGQEFPVRI